MTSQGARPDPGWGTPLRRFLPFIIIPVLVVKRSSSDEQRIVQLRTAFLAFVGALFALLAVLAVLFPFTTDGPVDPVVYALVAIGPATWAAIPWTRNKLLGFCGPPSQLAGAYITGLFINIAFIESAALFGFVAAFLGRRAVAIRGRNGRGTRRLRRDRSDRPTDPRPGRGPIHPRLRALAQDRPVCHQ